MARTAAATKLAKYRAKRDFARTAEPSGQRAPAHAGNRFVIHKHAARRLHYDFRLELDGVLLSWAVPRGPSLVPGEKRLAVRTEDHPLDYADFEGVIPEGEYGGGAVVVWDRGTWQAEGDPREGMAKGRLTFALAGQKLHGTWHLVRTRSATRQEQWLLLKSRDDAANENTEIVEAQPRSVISGRTIEQVAHDRDRVWHSSRVDVNELIAQLPLGFPLTNLDKLLYPEERITKGQVIAYLAVVADWMLPHVASRPLTLVRYPNGIGTGKGFYQKQIYPGAPKAIHTVDIREESGKTVPYMQVRDMPGLVGLAQLGTLEIHVWGCHADQVERPDFMVFDLDPDPSVPWERVALAALDVRRRLGELGLASWVKTTGGKGLHVCVPVTRRQGWHAFKAWSKAFADQLAEAEPKLYTTNMAKSARKHRIFIDYLRNGRNATFIAPYSLRARPGAPVSTPIAWEELAAGIEPGAFTIETVPPRLARLADDPWADLGPTKQAITAATWRAVGGQPP